ncbi:BTB/POZ domain containing protein [Trichomonas vaginalis G3]|uniref:BTB/POZ domain containing protein n=1 Tax=Trichomonas vaginalis (strain ATCC PRA-98 / G3) TaxID=412133 RepID=A2EZN4_TRIV3|nr:Potassium Channel Kv1.1, Chain A domain-containing protein [Trichomonas vaginalis G3]EAY01872.1 BTB/POZ domain containing protein [Trichomonas vaginalis G3]KAI5549671.1 Potassium Channel Kv1.1, Chain A domain-containing protein [Trichomonas vaginalis G3]|eukprot:XP_001314416.1 BTB/POZ domain containing protein [Trichomonas vaginalis G3]
MSDKQDPNYNTEIDLDPLWDFLDYYKTGELADCTIVADGKELKCHQIVLANGSEFFKDNFTSGDTFKGSSERRIDITVNPEGKLEKVIEFLYCGQITLSEDELMPLLEIAIFYRISILKALITEQLDKITDHNKIMNMFTECFDKDYSNATKVFPTYIAKFYNKYSKKQISDCLDTDCFLNTLLLLKMKSKDMATEILSFFNDFNFFQDEATKQAHDTFMKFIQDSVKDNNDLTKILKSKKPEWFK